MTETLEQISVNEPQTTLREISQAKEQDRNKVIQVMTLGFSADPVARWIWPDALTYQNAMPRFANAFGGRAIDNGTAYMSDDFRAASLWLAPGVEPDGDTIEEILGETTNPAIADDLAEMFAQMDANHPKEPHWYLPMIAADPGYLNQGHGGALLEEVLPMIDERGEVAYLESSNYRNISLYLRFGFEVITEIRPGSAKPMYPMVRKPRK